MHCTAIAGAALAASILCTAASAQHPTQQQDAAQPMYVAPASTAAQEQIAAFTLAPGLQCQLVAAEPDLCNVVAFAIDGKGTIYVSETFRIHDGVFDTREHMQWKDEDLACLTVQDRIAKYEKYLSKEIPGYAKFSERVKVLFDDDKDGRVDRSEVFASGFADLADGIASGVLPIGHDVWFTDIPRLWRLTDSDSDGKAEAREAVFDGFGVHTSLIGHDLHGLCLGPDRRLYFSIGDRGFCVVTKEGRTLAFPHEGAVLRCELDGTNLEVVHRGLRNPQELAFDDHGNLFTGDNNSDGGDRARIVQIVDGADSGWRIGFQWLDDRGAWNDERMWVPARPGQPAATLPPVMNLGDGPSGLVFDPGAGLPARYRGCFFLCDFRGGSSYSGVHALRLVNQGAGFEIAFHDKPIWGVLATDVDFGPDGALYVSDWVSGWNKTGKGRIYRVEATGQQNDMQRRATQKLLASDLRDRTDGQLLELLRHADRRVRQAAQFALVDRGAAAVLLAAAKDPDDARLRLHGVFGLSILGKKDSGAMKDLLPLLSNDGDADVRAMIARGLGDARLASAAPELVKALRDDSARVRREAALALARLCPSLQNGGEGGGADVLASATDALIDVLALDGGRDAVLRHAAVMGLCGTTPNERLLQLRDDARPAVRLGALLALRRRGDAAVAAFLADAEPQLVAEAARAIYDAAIDSALPQLAAMLPSPAGRERALAWRALNAARLLGRTEDAAAIAAFARTADRPEAMRCEAIAILAEWKTPHGQDRVLGNWRPCVHLDPAAALRAVAPDLVALLADRSDAVVAAAAAACRDLRIATADAPLAAIAGDRARGSKARVAALTALAGLESAATDQVVAAITADDPTELRQEAVRLFAERQPQKAAPVLATLCERAETKERQAAFAALGKLADPAGAAILRRWLDELAAGHVDAEVQLDLLLAAKARAEPEVQQQLVRVTAAATDDPLAKWLPCLQGGDVERGRSIFFDHEATRCTRCHTVGGRGGNAGPVLDDVGSKERRYLLEALATPSKQIAQGFATTVLELHNGDLVAGIVTKDQDGAVTITPASGEAQQVPWDRIKSRRTATESAMPVMAGPLDERQVRDVIAYLASLRATPAAK